MFIVCFVVHPSACEECRILSFEFLSFIAPTLIYVLFLALALSFHNKHLRTQLVTRSRGQHCGDIEMTGYLANQTDPVSLVLDLRITHERVGRSSDLSLNGHFHAGDR